MLIPFLSSLLFSFLLCLGLAKAAPRLGLMDAPDRPRKTHPRRIPRIGGLAVWLAATLTALVFPIAFPWPLWRGVSCMGLVGLFDDRFELPPWIKLGLQWIAAALLLESQGFQIPTGFTGVAALFGVLAWLVLITNAVNYTDNINGLCGGFIFIAFLGIYFLQKDPLIGIVAGSVFGFLLLNFPSGRVFLGDSGSHLLGVLFGIKLWMLVLSHHGYARLLPLLLAALPLVDFAQVTLGRLRRGKPIWEGDSNHLSHLLVRRGWTLVQTVLFLWGAAALGVIGAIAFE